MDLAFHTCDGCDVGGGVGACIVHGTTRNAMIGGVFVFVLKIDVGLHSSFFDSGIYAIDIFTLLLRVGSCRPLDSQVNTLFATHVCTCDCRSGEFVEARGFPVRLLLPAADCHYAKR